MNIREANGHYERHTTTLSTVSRQAAFAGLAVAWTLRSTIPGAPPLSGALAWAAVLYVCGLLADVAQYAVLSARWQEFISQKRDELHQKHGDDLSAQLGESFTVPQKVNKAGILALWMKQTLYLLGHLFLLSRLVGLIAA
jgi:hypothetical protein